MSQDISSFVEQNIKSRTRMLILIGVIVGAVLIISTVFSSYLLVRINQNADNIQNFVSINECRDEVDDQYLLAIGDLIGDNLRTGEPTLDHVRQFLEAKDDVEALYVNPETNEPWPEGEGPCSDGNR